MARAVTFIQGSNAAYLRLFENRPEDLENGPEDLAGNR
jgi:hypothetical protein